LLIHYLENRFGALPPSVQQDILAADANSLDAWVDLALKALDFRAIFGRPDRAPVALRPPFP
jgi:hypothetical protein